MTSLDELRAIQQQRIADEKASFERERAAQSAARHAAEAARIAAEDAKLQAERAERVRVERARADAEREARLRVEAAEAAERARLQIMLEEQRRVEELALRRAEVARKRPTWMLVVTGLAVCAGLALTWFAVDRARDADRANVESEGAKQRQLLAMQELQHSRDELVRIHANLDQFEGQLAAAQKAVADAQTDVDRKRAAAVAQDAARKAHDVQVQLQKEREHQEWLIRHQGLNTDKKCLDTALGCLGR